MRVLAPPRTEDPGDRQSRHSPQAVDRTRSARIGHAPAQSVAVAELGEPPSAPDPMAEQRVGQACQQRGRCAARTQLPTLSAGAERNLRYQCGADYGEPCAERGGGSIQIE